jgi:hypothetical protein
VSDRRDERRRKGDLEMYGDGFYAMEDRVLREQDLAERIAERERYAWSKRGPSLRARVARRLFALAVAAEREETWRLVWEKLEARGRL